MRFEWDERKNQINCAKHGFDFADAYLVFNMPMVVELDARENYGEDRYIRYWFTSRSSGGGGLYRTCRKNN